jgi:hypothetical protein
MKKARYQANSPQSCSPGKGALKARWAKVIGTPNSSETPGQVQRCASQAVSRLPRDPRSTRKIGRARNANHSSMTKNHRWPVQAKAMGWGRPGSPSWFNCALTPAPLGAATPIANRGPSQRQSCARRCPAAGTPGRLAPRRRCRQRHGPSTKGPPPAWSPGCDGRASGVGGAVGQGEPELGYRRIHGELCRLGFRIGASTVWAILHRAGVEPAPKRSALTWRRFRRAQAKSVLAVDLLHCGHRVPATPGFRSPWPPPTGHRAGAAQGCDAAPGRRTTRPQNLRRRRRASDGAP